MKSFEPAGFYGKDAVFIMSKPIFAVLWDLDGTLLDVEPLATDAINSVLAPFGAFCDKELKLKITGMRPADWTRTIINDLGLQGHIDEETLHRGTNAALTALLPSCEPLPGVESVTAGLAAAGIPQAIATSSDAAAVAKKRLRHEALFARMRAIITGETVPHGKPAPDIFLAAAAALGVPSASCVVVEDSVLGVAAGAAAGCRVVAVPAPGSDEAAFRAAGAATVLKSLDEWDWRGFMGLPPQAGAGAGAVAAGEGSGGAAAMPAPVASPAEP